MPRTSTRDNGIADNVRNRHLCMIMNRFVRNDVNDLQSDPAPRLSWKLRVALVPVVALLNFAINLFGVAMRGQDPGHPPPPLLRLLTVSSFPALSWVALSIPVQLATRRLVRERLPVAVAGHAVVAPLFHLSHSVLLMGMMVVAGVSNPRVPFLAQVERYAVGSLPLNLLVYTALVAGTLAWDNWRLSIRRERTATHLASELTRAELSALRSKMQPHFLFNALHGISSVMETDVVKAREMMVALSNLLRSSLHGSGDRAALEQEVQFARDYLDLQHMRFEDRLIYDLRVDAKPQVRVPSFILQPLVENAVIHAMADRSEPTRVSVVVKQLADEVEMNVSDDGPGFPDAILNGTKPLGVGLSALKARVLALPGGRGSLTLQNRPGGGAHVIVRVMALDEDGENA